MAFCFYEFKGFYFLFEFRGPLWLFIFMSLRASIAFLSLRVCVDSGWYEAYYHRCFINLGASINTAKRRVHIVAKAV